jgi:hypothetical protein
MVEVADRDAFQAAKLIGSPPRRRLGHVANRAIQIDRSALVLVAAQRPTLGQSGDEHSSGGWHKYRFKEMILTGLSIPDPLLGSARLSCPSAERVKVQGAWSNHAR